MNQVVVVINEEGKFDTVLADSEVDIQILKRGEDDWKIEEAEGKLTEVNL